MPVIIVYADEGRGVILIGEGIVDGQEIIDAVTEMFSIPERTEKLEYSLDDYTEVRDFILNPNQVRVLAGIDLRASKLNPDLIVAVAASENLEFGLARMWGLVSESQTGWETTVVRSRNEAENWIRERRSSISLSFN